MAVTDRNLKIGTTLAVTYKEQHRTCKLTKTKAGIRFVLDDGREFTSISSAGKGITGKACDGWLFFTVQREGNGDVFAGRPKVERPRQPVAVAVADEDDGDDEDEEEEEEDEEYEDEDDEDEDDEEPNFLAG